MEAAQPILVALFAITVMGSVGVDLTIDRVWVVFRRPRTLVVGLLLLIVGYQAPVPPGNKEEEKEEE